jgi:undecaprenyl-diphosphatase
LALAALALLWGAMLWLGTGTLDRQVLDALYAGGHEAWTVFALIVTRFGDPDLLSVATGAIALLLIARRHLHAAAFLLAAGLLGRAAVNLQKYWIARPRPDAHLHLIGTRTDSFPSGHAASAVMTWVALALLIPRESPLRRPALVAAVLLSLLAGVSRPMLGVHWPSDVIAGWSFGLVWIALLVRLFRIEERTPLRPS